MIAPDFDTQDVFGNRISLQSYAASGKRLHLNFFRNAACAMCNLQVHRLIQQYPTYQQSGVEIIAVFESPEANILQYVTRQNVPFPIIADPGAKLYDLYGVETSQEKVMAQVDMDWRNGLIQEAEAIGYPLTKEEGSNFFRLPAEFLIGQDQKIYEAYYAEVVGVHLPHEAVDSFMAQLV
jgi:peroxiredoxin